MAQNQTSWQPALSLYIVVHLASFQLEFVFQTRTLRFEMKLDECARQSSNESVARSLLSLLWTPGRLGTPQGCVENWWSLQHMGFHTMVWSTILDTSKWMENKITNSDSMLTKCNAEFWNAHPEFHENELPTNSNIFQYTVFLKWLHYWKLQTSPQSPHVGSSNGITPKWRRQVQSIYLILLSDNNKNLTDSIYSS